MGLMDRLKTFGRANTKTEIVYRDRVVKDTLGGFFTSNKKLSDEKTVSTRLLQANAGWVYRNNDVIAKEVANIEFELYKINLRGGQEEFVEVDDSPILDALDQFNNTTTKSDAIYTTQSHKKLTGDAFWYIESSGIEGTPSYTVDAIYILPPDKVSLKLGSPQGGDDVLVEGYEYKDTIDGKKIEREYTPEEIIHFKTPNPNNMFRGYGAVEAAAETIDLDNLTTEVNRKFFDNGAITNFVLSTDSKITQDQLKRLKNELKAAYGGSKKAFQTMILAGGLKPENISYTNKELEFLGQLEWYRDKIMVLFGNTKASLGIIDDVNRAAHESSMLSWKRNSIKPEMDAIVNTLNEFFIPKFGQNVVLGYADPVPEDRTAKLDEAVKLLGANAISVNEARTSLGYDELDGQDDLKQEVEVPEALRSVNLKAVLRKQGFYKKKELSKELKSSARKLLESKRVKKEVKEEPKVKSQYTEEEITKYWYNKNSIVNVTEQIFENTVEQYIGKIVDDALAKLDQEISKAAKKELLDEEELEKEALALFVPLLLAVAYASGQQAFMLIGIQEPYLGLNMRQVIERNVLNFTRSMLKTDRDIMIDILTNGVEDGLSNSEISRKIREKFADYTKTQADRITRTEVQRANIDATLDAFEESGTVEGKQWITARDGRVDADCAQYEGKIVYDLGGKFYEPNNIFQDGNPPIHTNCRCDLIPVVSNKSYTPVTSVERKTLTERIEYLEDLTDKRTKAYKEIKHKYQEEKADDTAYIRALEKHLGVSDAGEEPQDAAEQEE